MISWRLLGSYREAQTHNTLIASIRRLYDPRLTIRYMNDGFLALVGYSRGEIEDRFQNSFRAMIVRDDFEQAASLDGLTGLLNRGLAQTSIQQYLASTETAPVGAFILVDADNFKAVNDTYGHPFADTVLTDIAAYLPDHFVPTILCAVSAGTKC